MKSRGKAAFLLSTSQRVHLEGVVWSMLSRLPSLKRLQEEQWQLTQRDLEGATDVQLLQLAVELRGYIVKHSKRHA